MNILNRIKSIFPAKIKKQYILTMELSSGEIQFIESSTDNCAKVYTSLPIFPKYDNMYLINLDQRITQAIPGIDFISFDGKYSVTIKKSRLSSWEIIVEPLLRFIDEEISLKAEQK